MTVWEQEQNRTQNWLTPSAKIWPRLNHHLESDVFPLSFPESQIWMKQHKRGPSLKTWEPSQIFTVPIFQPPLKELNAETCRNMPKPDLLELKDARKRYDMAWKCLKHFLWSSLFFPSFSGTSQDSTSAMRLPVIPRQIASKAHLGARYQRSRGFRSLGSCLSIQELIKHHETSRFWADSADWQDRLPARSEMGDMWWLLTHLNSL